MVSIRQNVIHHFCTKSLDSLVGEMYKLVVSSWAATQTCQMSHSAAFSWLFPRFFSQQEAASTELKLCGNSVDIMVSMFIV